MNTSDSNYLTPKMCVISFLGGTAIPAWAIVLLSGITMLLLGGGVFVLLQKFVIDAADTGESHSYQPTLQIEN